MKQTIDIRLDASEIDNTSLYESPRTGKKYLITKIHHTMKQKIDISLDVSKIDKTALYESPKTGKKYLNLTVLIREEKDQYQNDGFIVQKISKERKAAGEKGPILGNAKIMDWDAPNPNMHGGEKSNGYAPKPNVQDDDDSIPF